MHNVQLKHTARNLEKFLKFFSKIGRGRKRRLETDSKKMDATQLFVYTQIFCAKVKRIQSSDM